MCSGKINSQGRKYTIYLHEEVKHLLNCSVHGFATLCFGPLVYTNLYNLTYVARLSWCIMGSGSCDRSARQETLSYVQQQNGLTEGTQLKPNNKPDLTQTTTDSTPILVSTFPKSSRLRQGKVEVTYMAGMPAVVRAAQHIVPFASWAYCTYLCPIRTYLHQSFPCQVCVEG